MKETRHIVVRRAIGAGLALVVMASGAAVAQERATALLAPKACRASGLWVLERQAADALTERWETLAMAPWATWAAGFTLADGRGGGLAIRVSSASVDRIELTGAQSGVDEDPAVFMRSDQSGCTFYSPADGLVYRFRRER